MTVIKSISGIRGTVGGSPTDGFNPLTIAHFVVGYAQHIKLYESISRPTIVVGRDARLSGEERWCSKWSSGRSSVWAAM